MAENNQTKKISEEKGTTLKNVISMLFRKPLLHFVLIGAVAYLAYNILKEEVLPGGESENTITVTQGEVSMMTDSWQKRWNRPPTETELDGIVNEYIKEMVYYRTALEMGLGENDPRIRRLLAQKLQFVTSGLIQPQEPGEGELKRYFRENINKYTPPPYVTITQIFFDPDLRGDNTLEDARSTMAMLNRVAVESVSPGKYGDNIMLQNYYPQRTEQDLSKLFGNEFAKSVFVLSSGQWHGPVLSGYGTHVVYVHSRKEPEAPKFGDIKDQVLSGWMEDKQNELNELYYKGLLGRYEVVVEEEGVGGPGN